MKTRDRFKGYIIHDAGVTWASVDGCVYGSLNEAELWRLQNVAGEEERFTIYEVYEYRR